MVKNFCDEIWRQSIGHYGGLFVEIPKEKLKSFKGRFPSRQFPRRVKRKIIQDMGFGVEFEERFHRANPKSGGVYYDMFFADRSKGLKTLRRLITKNRCWRRARWKS